MRARNACITHVCLPTAPAMPAGMHATDWRLGLQRPNVSIRHSFLSYWHSMYAVDGYKLKDYVPQANIPGSYPITGADLGSGGST